MLIPTPAQEAAFNAVGEAMRDLAEAIPLEGKSTYRSFSVAHYPDFSPNCFFVHLPKPGRQTDNMSGGGKPTAGEAFVATLAAHAEYIAQPPKLETASEAIDAIKALVSDPDTLAAIDALPV